MAVRVRGRHWRWLLALGATGIAAFHTTVYLALTQTTATNALLMLALAPVAILAASALIGGAGHGDTRRADIQRAGCGCIGGSIGHRDGRVGASAMIALRSGPRRDQ